MRIPTSIALFYISCIVNANGIPTRMRTGQAFRRPNPNLAHRTSVENINLNGAVIVDQDDGPSDMKIYQLPKVHVLETGKVSETIKITAPQNAIGITVIFDYLDAMTGVIVTLQGTRSKLVQYTNKRTVGGADFYSQRIDGNIVFVKANNRNVKSSAARVILRIKRIGVYFGDTSCGSNTLGEWSVPVTCLHMAEKEQRRPSYADFKRELVFSASLAVARIYVYDENPVGRAPSRRECQGFLLGHDGFLLTTKACIPNEKAASRASFHFMHISACKRQCQIMNPIVPHSNDEKYDYSTGYTTRTQEFENPAKLIALDQRLKLAIVKLPTLKQGNGLAYGVDQLVRDRGFVISGDMAVEESIFIPHIPDGKTLEVTFSDNIDGEFIINDYDNNQNPKFGLFSQPLRHPVFGAPVVNTDGLWLMGIVMNERRVLLLSALMKSPTNFGRTIKRIVNIERRRGATRRPVK